MANRPWSKIVLTAIESLTGTILELLDKTEKELTSMPFEFYVGKIERVTTRTLATQLKGGGDLSITLVRSKLEVYKESYKDFQTTKGGETLDKSV